MFQAHIDQGDEWGDDQSPQVRVERDSAPCTYRGKQLDSMGAKWF